MITIIWFLGVTSFTLQFFSTPAFVVMFVNIWRQVNDSMEAKPTRTHGGALDFRFAIAPCLPKFVKKVSHGCTSFGARHQYLDVWHQFGGDDYAPIRKVSYRPTACPMPGWRTPATAPISSPICWRRRSRRESNEWRASRQHVIAGLDPAIHLLRKTLVKIDWCAFQGWSCRTQTYHFKQRRPQLRDLAALARVLLATFRLLKIRGRRECRVRDAPTASRPNSRRYLEITAAAWRSRLRCASTFISSEQFWTRCGPNPTQICVQLPADLWNQAQDLCSAELMHR